MVKMLSKSLVRPSKTSPAFLESNATSHTWSFSAIAELIDNAYEPDVKSSQISINFEDINGAKCLTFTDDGVGMDQDQLYKMLSFGYSDKKEDGYKPIGRYGNGFKSGSMRLGKDAIVLTRNLETTSVGLLSQTYLKGIDADTVLIPIVTFSNKDRSLHCIGSSKEESQENLQAVLKWTMFKSAENLLDCFNAALAPFNKTGKIWPTGTKIIIFNLKPSSESAENLNGPQKFELEFDFSKKDIINNSAALIDQPEYRRSLKKYCSILYLKPRMKIFILNEKVRQRLIARDLCKTETDTYSPKWAGKQKNIKITFGFNPNKNQTREEYANSDYGIMIYNRNRLIQAFEKVGYQRQPNELGVGVVGVLEVDALVPIHNKQSFSVDSKYNSLMLSLASKLNYYWDSKVPKLDAENGIPGPENPNLTPDCTWAQCDTCLKWRRLPPGVTEEELPDKWHCEDNPDVEYNSCDRPEQKLEEGELDLGFKTSGGSMKFKRKRKTPSGIPVRKSAKFVRLEQTAEALMTENTTFRTQLDNEQKEREKYQKKLQQEKIRRQSREICWDQVQRNINALTRESQLILAYISSDIDQNDVTNSDTSATKPSPDSAIDKNYSTEENGQVLAKCARCLCWRTIQDWPQNDDQGHPFNREKWLCKMHPNQRIRYMCHSVEEILDGIEQIPLNTARIKVEKVKVEQQVVVDLTQDDGKSRDVKPDDQDLESTDAEDEKEKTDKEQINVLQNQVVDLRMKLKAMQKLTNQKTLIKTETLHSFVQTDLSIGYSTEQALNSSLASCQSSPIGQNRSQLNNSNMAADQSANETSNLLDQSERDNELSLEMRRLTVELIKFCGVTDLEKRIDVNNSEHVTKILKQIVQSVKIT